MNDKVSTIIDFLLFYFVISILATVALLFIYGLFGEFMNQVVKCIVSGVVGIVWGWAGCFYWIRCILDD